MRNDDFLRELGLNAVVTRMKRISDAMLHDGKRTYKQLGMDIEPNWFVIFKLLKKRGPVAVTDIADGIGLSHPSVIAIVNKMMNAGYLSESRTDDDNRKRILNLTPKAESKMPEFEAVWDAGMAGFKRMMHDADVLGVLDKLEDRIAEKGFRIRTLDQLEKMKSVEIVSYEDRYRKDFADLNYEWIAKYYSIEDHDHEQLDDPRHSVLDPGGEIFFALVDGKAAGTVALIRLNYDVFELAKMAVSPDFQGYKLGDKLMRACIDYSRQAGMKYIVLESNTKQFAAISLYRKYGFREVPFDPNSPYLRSNIRMELAL